MRQNSVLGHSWELKVKVSYCISLNKHPCTHLKFQLHVKGVVLTGRGALNQGGSY